MTRPEQLGNKMGPRVARLTADAVVHAQTRLLHTRKRLVHSVIDDVFRTIRREQHETVGPFIDAVFRHPEAPDYMRRLGDLMLGHRGQWQEMLANSVVAGGVSSSLIGVFTDLAAPATLRLIEENPNMVLDAATAAGLVARGFVPYEFGNVEAARNGINADRFDALVRAAEAWPPFDVLLQLWHRGAIREQDVAQALHRQGVAPELRGNLLALRDTLLPPALLADAVLRGWIPQERGAREAAMQGVSAERFQIMVDDTGEPPGLQELLFAYRRGIIDRPRLEHGIRESRVRNEWIDVVEALRFSPPSIGEALEGFVKGYIPKGEAERVAAQNGLDPKHFDWVAESQGNPPGTEQLLRLYNRGEIGLARLEHGIRASRYKNEWIPEIVKLRRAVPSVIQLRLLVEQGAVPDDEAIRYLLDDGYPHATAAAFVHAWHGAKTSKHKELAVSEIENLYEEQVIARADAEGMLHDLGYTVHDVSFMLDLVDLRRERHYYEAAIARVHTLYVGHRIDAAAARGIMDRLNVPPRQEAHLFTLWDMEREANVRTLTEAQVVRALKGGFMDQAGAVQRLREMGYSPDDAAILVAL